MCVLEGACGSRDVRGVWKSGQHRRRGNESIEQEGTLGEALVEAEVEHKAEEEALVAETRLTATRPTWTAKMLNHSPRTF